MRTFTGANDEELILSLLSGDLVVFGTEDDAEGESEAWFDFATAEQIADALYELVGAAPRNRVTASEISFNEGAIRLAGVHNRTIKFRYAKGDGSTIEERTFIPGKVSRSDDGDLYFTGYDPDRGAPRAYRLDRIKGTVAVAAD